MYAQSPQALPARSGHHIRQITSAHVTTILYYGAWLNQMLVTAYVTNHLLQMNGLLTQL